MRYRRKFRKSARRVVRRRFGKGKRLRRYNVSRGGIRL